jgi:hypothetical protein
LAGFLKNKWTRRLAMWVLAPIALIYGFIQFNYPTCTFRYKLTAEVMTPEGLKTGSSVIEVSYSSTHPLPNPGRWSADTLTGEAVYVDLGGGKNLFVLLGLDRWERKASRLPSTQPSFDGIEGGQDSVTEQQLGEGSLNALWLPVHVFKLGRTVGEERDMQRRAMALLGQSPVEVPLINVPMVGTFADLARPETFDTLLPTDIKKTLGEGYALQSVNLQIVDQNNSAIIESILPWLLKQPEKLLLKCGRSAADLKSPLCWVRYSHFKIQNLAADFLS